jgi:hypothetical protein
MTQPITNPAALLATAQQQTQANRYIYLRYAQLEKLKQDALKSTT